MLKIRKFSDRSRSTFGIVARILRELQEPTGISGIISSCNVNFNQSGYCLGFMKSSDLIQIGVISGRVKYRKTGIGQKFLEIYDKMILLLNPSLFIGSPM